MYGHTYRLSIQFTLNGFSFYLKNALTSEIISYQTNTVHEYERLNELFGLYRIESVYAGFATNEVVLVPAELFAADNAARYLEQRGFVMGDNSNVIFNDSISGDIVAVWNNAWGNILPEDIQTVYYHPLQLILSARPFTAMVDRNDGCMNISVTSDRLLTAETYRIDNDADMFFSLRQTIVQCGGYLKPEIICSGDRAAQSAEILSSYFDKVSTTEPPFAAL